MKRQLDNAKTLHHKDKMRHRSALAEEVNKRNKIKSQVADLNEWVEELAEELRDAKRATKAAVKDKVRAKGLASKRLAFLKDMKVKLNECRDDLIEELHCRDALERMNTIHLAIKREKILGVGVGPAGGQFTLSC